MTAVFCKGVNWILSTLTSVTVVTLLLLLAELLWLCTDVTHLTIGNIHCSPEILNQANSFQPLLVGLIAGVGSREHVQKLTPHFPIILHRQLLQAARQEDQRGCCPFVIIDQLEGRDWLDKRQYGFLPQSCQRQVEVVGQRKTLLFSMLDRIRLLNLQQTAR